MLKTIVVGPVGANCYIVGDPEAGVGALIDPGGDPQKVLSAVKGSGLDIRYVIATHGHFDHTGAIGPVVEALGAEFLMHEEDLFFARDSVASAGRWGVNISQVPDPDRFLTDGDIVEVGAVRLKVIHTPGHSPGGVCLHDEDAGELFCGDTLFQRSIGRTDFRQGSMDVLVSSIRERLFVLPEETVVHTGHGPATTIGEEKRLNPFVRC